MTTTDELRSQQTELHDQITALANLEGDLDETQRTDWDTANTEYDQVTATLTERQGRASRVAALGDTDRSTGDGAQAASTARDSLQARVQLAGNEIYERSDLDVHNPSDGAAYRDRAMRAIEQWNPSIEAGWRESAERLVSSAAISQRDRLVADHILRTSHPDYVDAFYRYLAGGPDSLNNDQHRALNDANRALNEGSTAAGGAIVPPFLDPSIILTNAGINNPFRSIATVKTIATQTWKGVTSAGVTAEWTAEAAEMTDASPTFVQPSITPIRADAYVQASFEVIEDTNIASELAMLFADARDRLEGTAFATGTGSTQPFGVVTELQLVTASRTASTTNGAMGAVDIFNLDSNLAPRYRNNASWVANKAIWNSVRQFATGPSQQQSAFWVDFGSGQPASLIGYPVYLASAMQQTLSTATASNDDVIVLGDFRNGYYIVDRIGMSVAYNPLVLGSNRRPTGEVGWAAFWRVGARVVSATAFQMLRV